MVGDIPARIIISAIAGRKVLELDLLGVDSEPGQLVPCSPNNVGFARNTDFRAPVRMRYPIADRCPAGSDVGNGGDGTWIIGTSVVPNKEVFPWRPRDSLGLDRAEDHGV